MKIVHPCTIFNTSFGRLTPAETSATYSVSGIRAGTIIAKTFPFCSCFCTVCAYI
ncbi:hypothetical protein HMPREF1325_0155 [Treponema socranskii subsp. socranskii VPI DR56BR1116 = ATCC 35536]|uniref:Uncharacterized protein n=1 Tax=Treponema socranskii subsp. socranskii VPI DR56BR1116 = ATCC 35536 TaxID=1125725 RepID=U1FN10_TRESO|nr:hypothetical protein HMPREF1325_0155 [Treponema socranskii subsp. socranskii VPI DR56BR1116 = ATCC 35536]